MEKYQYIAINSDCEAAAGALLIDRKEWPAPVADKDREWFRFLSDAGVVDGLVAIPANVPDWPIQGDNWMYYLSVTKDPALDAVWLQKCGLATPLSHPRTDYSRHGEAFKLPGQVIVHELSDDARRRFAALVVRHLQSFGNKHLQFELLSNLSSRGTQDKRTLKSPLATFLSTAAWFPMEAGSELEFVHIADGWVITAQPRFVPRAIEEIASILAKDGLATELLAANGLRFWRDKATAADRLEALAEVCEVISQHERPVLRKCYDEAWRDMIELGQPLPHEVRLVVERPIGFASIAGTEPRTCVYVRTDKSADLAKLLIDTGALVLVTNADCPYEAVISTISATGGFDAQSTDKADVRLLVNDEPFLTNLADPLLVDVVPWLVEALVLGHELGARSLEKSAHVGAVLERLRRLRLRQSLSIELESGVGTAKRLQRYLHRDDVCPTLIVEGRFDAEQLGDAASLIAPYVHPNRRTFELLLVRLAHRLSNNSELLSIRPTEAEYAYAIQADLDEVREHLAAYRHDDSHKIELVVPLVAYHVGVENARELAPKLSNSGFTQWFSLIGGYLPEGKVHELMAAIEKTEDLAVLRKDLKLDYARFNRVLVELGRGSLTSESELRRLFNLWKSDLRQQLSDRLRRHFAPTFNDHAAFTPYAELRSLDFMTFNEVWGETHETLHRKDVAVHADHVFTKTFGEDPGGELPELETIRKANRKAVAMVAERAKPLLRAVAPNWVSPEWNSSAAEIAAILDRAGLLDFHQVDETEIIALMVRVGLWPEGLAKTLDLAIHGLSGDDLDREKSRAAEQQVEEQRRRNRVEFAGNEFYAGDTEFASLFASVVHAAFAEGDWQNRSKTGLVSITIQPESGNSGAGKFGGKGGGRLASKPSEAVRAAIGLAGELLAYEYLKRKHRNHFSDECWVSENRTSLYPESGDDSQGYDFRVNTVQTEWLYEVKATPGDACEFELSDNEYRVAVSAQADRSRRYRILFVQYAFDPSLCRILELPNPTAEAGKSRFRVIGRSSQRMRFELG